MASSEATGGYSIFHETMADMTFREIEAAARDGAIVLWGLGVIEEHGPHLPLATDVYVPYATLREVRRLLAERGVPAIIAPLFYWGVNAATASFAGSFVVRPEVMIELMKDVFRSLRKDGFTSVYCLSGHGDAAHNRALLTGVRAGSAYGEIDGALIVAPAMARRLELDLKDRHLIVTAPVARPPEPFLDVHAGNDETSMIWGHFPDVVRADVVPGLAPTNALIDDLLEWRKGGEHARRTTPDGYLGSPASADPDRGRALIHAEALCIADAISARCSNDAAPGDR
jgi:creatinine amidohydrolase